MRTIDQKICLSLMPIALTVMIGSLAIAGFLPPMAPSLTAAEVADFYREHGGSIRAGLVIINVCGAFLTPFFVVVALRIKRMTLSSNTFFYAYLMCVGASTGLFMISDLVWLVAAFRGDRDPQAVQLLNDIGWVCFVAPVGVLVAQTLMLGGAILLDAGATRVFPRWAGWFNIAASICFVPSMFAVMHLTGPLAWDGSLAFWLRYIAFVVYLMVMFVLVRRSLAEDDNQVATEFEREATRSSA